MIMRAYQPDSPTVI